MGAEVHFDPEWWRHIDVAGRELLDRLGSAILADMRAGCPRDTNVLLEALDKATVDTAAGPVEQIGSRGVDYAASVEMGSRPHVIRSHGPWPLRNRETGQVFGQVVHHPGTKAQPFMRPALYKQRDL